MFYKEIQKLKKSELQDLLATTLQQKATLERANCSFTNELYRNIDERDLEIDELNDKYSELNKYWADRYNTLQNDIIDTSQELLETETELVELRASVIELDKENENLKMENRIHLREKQEAREIAENYSLSNNQLRNQIAEGSTPKNVYIHESNSIFADSGELYIEADDNKTVVFNCSTLVQDLAIINDIVIKEAKKELSNNIQEIKSLTKDI